MARDAVSLPAWFTPLAEAHGARRPRQQRTVVLADRLLDAARALIADRGYDEVSVEDIAAACDCSISSFYARFESKDSVLVALAERYRCEAVERTEQLIAMHHPATVADHVRTAVVAYHDFQNDWLRADAAFRFSAAARQVGERFQRWLATRLVACDPRLDAERTWWLIHVAHRLLVNTTEAVVDSALPPEKVQARIDALVDVGVGFLDGTAPAEAKGRLAPVEVVDTGEHASVVWATPFAVEHGVVPPRQARSARVALAVATVARERLRRQSFDDLSVDELCADVGITMSSFYARFERKFSLLAAIFEWYRIEAEALIERLAPLQGEPITTVVPVVLTNYYAFAWRWYGTRERFPDYDELAAAHGSMLDAVSFAAFVVMSSAGGAHDEPADPRRVESALRLGYAMVSDTTAAAERGEIDERIVAERLGYLNEMVVIALQP